MKLFDCDKCGVCCRNIRLSIFYTEELDRGDGVCKNFDEATKLCTIYNDRPIICNIDAYYEKFLSQIMSRQKFHEINHDACARLKKFDSEN
ncbi:MAG: YkgJ family cysteine cluster protein [Selenomonadaceae bacterium]|nr:YkgJ family cysteine cluster protein [Selenomonadaceae bacterium]